MTSQFQVRTWQGWFFAMITMKLTSILITYVAIATPSFHLSEGNPLSNLGFVHLGFLEYSILIVAFTIMLFGLTWKYFRIGVIVTTIMVAIDFEHDIITYLVTAL